MIARHDCQEKVSSSSVVSPLVDVIARRAAAGTVTAMCTAHTTAGGMLDYGRLSLTHIRLPAPDCCAFAPAQRGLCSQVSKVVGDHSRLGVLVVVIVGSPADGALSELWAGWP